MADCICTCTCAKCSPDTRYTRCETDDERQERIKASKRLYNYKNRERKNEYNKLYQRGQLPYQQQALSQTANITSTPLVVLKIITSS